MICIAQNLALEREQEDKTTKEVLKFIENELK
jgi:hypothetical protein